MEERHGQQLSALGAGLLGLTPGSDAGGQTTLHALLDAGAAQRMGGQAAAAGGKIDEGSATKAGGTGFHI